MIFCRKNFSHFVLHLLKSSHAAAAAAAAKLLQSCLTLCDPRDSSPPGSPVPEILQQEHWSGLPFPIPGCLLNPGIQAASPAPAGEFFTTVPLGNTKIPRNHETCILTDTFI